MTRNDVRNYAVAALLVLATVPLYHYIIERANPPAEVSAPVSDNRPAARPAPFSERDMLSAMATSNLPLQKGTEGGVRCWNAVLFRQTRGRWEPVPTHDGQFAQCEIQAVPVRPDSSQATD